MGFFESDHPGQYWHFSLSLWQVIAPVERKVYYQRGKVSVHPKERNHASRCCLQSQQDIRLIRSGFSADQCNHAIPDHVTKESTPTMLHV